MSKTRITIVITVIIIILTLVGYLTIVNNTSTRNLVAPLVNPWISNPKTSSVEGTETTKPKSPKTFKFDSSTDLKTELEKVDPKLLDSDFE